MSWLTDGLKNIQGQLVDFTSEVLSETTEEVEDKGTEIQVYQKRVTELTSRLEAGNQQIQSLILQVQSADERAEAAELQLSGLSDRYRDIIDGKDEEIRQLQNQIHSDSENKFGNLGNQWQSDFLSGSPPLSPSQEFELRQLRDETKQLKAEVSHWKGLVKERSGGEDLHEEVLSLRTQLSQSIDKHQSELISLQGVHYENLQAQRAQYEAKMAALQAETAYKQRVRSLYLHCEPDPWRETPDVDDDGWGNWNTDDSEVEIGDRMSAASSQTHASELMDRMETLEKQRDQLQQEREDLQREKSSLSKRVEDEKRTNSRLQSTVESLKQEEELQTPEVSRVEQLEAEVGELRQSLEALDEQNRVVVEQLLSSRDQATVRVTELEQAVQQSTEAKEGLEQTISQLRAENRELTSAYNDLNDEYESHKAESGSIVNANRDLNARIESLKADLIEYEEKYERCKSDNQSATEQLESLTNEFTRLKNGLEVARANTIDGETKLIADVSRLQSELKQSLEAREQLVAQVNEFHSTVEGVHTKLNHFQETNHLLRQENDGLKESMNHLSTMKEAFSETESELSILRIKLKEYQLENLKQEKQLREQIDELEEEAIQHKQDSRAAKEKTEALEAALARYRSVVGEQAAKIVERQASASGKSDDDTSGDSNGWDKLHEVDVEAIRSGVTGSTEGVRHLELQLREALAALTEKTEECEGVDNKLTEKSQELTERDELLQQAFTELKGLECQLADSREREAGLKSSLQKVTVDAARKEQEWHESEMQYKARLEQLEMMQGEAAGKTEESEVADQLAALKFEIAEQGVLLEQKSTELEALKEKQEALGKQRDEAASDFTSKESELIVRENELEKKLNELETERAKLEETSASLGLRQAQFNEAENALQLRIEEAERNEATLAASSHERAELDTAKLELTLREEQLHLRIAEVVTKEAGLATQIHEIEASKQEIASTRAELDAVRLELAQKEQQQQQLNSEQLQTKAHQGTEEIAQLQAQLAMEAARANELQTQLTSKEDQITDQKQELLHQEQQLIELDAEKEKLQKELASLKASTEQLTETVQERTRLLADDLDSKQHLSNELATVQQAKAQVEAEKEQLVVLVHEKHAECLKYHEAAQQSTVQLSQKEDQLQSLENELSNMKHLVDGLSQTADHEVQKNAAQIVGLEVEVNRLTEKVIQYESSLAASSQKEAEQERIRADLANVLHLKDRAVGELELERDRSSQLAAQLTQTDDNRSRTERELERLRMHLVQVEENYTREAVAAEERETGLRARLREAEDTVVSHSEAADSSNRQMADTMDDLHVQLSSLSRQRDGALLELADVQEQLDKSQKALVSLQAVLKQFQDERDSEVVQQVQQSRSDAQVMQQQLQDLAEQLASSQSGLTQLQSANQRGEMEMRNARALIETRDGELRQMELKLADWQTKGSNGKDVDKELLKNLFVGYLTAPDDKKREVARLLASILGFGAADLKKMESNQGAGWFGFLRGGTTPENSMTSQFIRFLETESTPSPSRNTTPLPSPMPLEMSHSHRSRTSSRNSPALGFHHRPSPIPTSDLSLPTFTSSRDTSSDILKEVLQD